MSGTIEVRNHKRVKDQLDNSKNLFHARQFEAGNRWCRGDFAEHGKLRRLLTSAARQSRFTEKQSRHRAMRNALGCRRSRD